MAELRDYQEDLLRQVEDALDANAKAWVMMQLSTSAERQTEIGEIVLLHVS